MKASERKSEKSGRKGVKIKFERGKRRWNLVGNKNKYSKTFFNPNDDIMTGAWLLAK